jgi:hypothetical protein
MTKAIAWLSFAEGLMLASLVSVPAYAQAPASLHSVTLSRAQVSRGPDGRVVITSDASGDLRGAFTLSVTSVAPDGSIRGEWALVNSYIEDLLGAGHSESDGHEEHDEGHFVGEVLVNRGTLNGEVTGGTLTFDSGGRVASASSVQLTVTLGSLTFSGIQSGTGVFDGSTLNDAYMSTGTVRLTF